MQSKNIPEINLLLNRIEKKYGRDLRTPSDFESLSAVMEYSTGDHISASTLKRLWGYIHIATSPRVATLNILAKYAGYQNFRDFCTNLENTEGFDSDFFSGQCVVASDLQVGEKVTMAWDPDRVIELEYLGNGEFKVIASLNSKLRVGDVFEQDSFILGYPVYIPRIMRDGVYTAPYYAAKKGGLTMLKSQLKRSEA